MLPLDSESLDGPTLARFAECFTLLGDQIRTVTTRSPHLVRAGDPDGYAESLLELQQRIRDVAGERGVRLSWLPMRNVEEAPPRSYVRLIGGVIEGLSYLSRHPAFTAPR